MLREILQLRSEAESGGVWRSVAECCGMWRSVAECGGVWRSVAECGECGMQVDIITNDSLSQLSETVSQKNLF